MPPDSPQSGDDERAPLLGTWRRWYTLVLAVMGVLVVLLAWASAHYQ
jgi:hypothetical protein